MNRFIILIICMQLQNSFGNTFAKQRTPNETSKPKPSNPSKQSVDKVEFKIEPEQKTENRSYFPHVDSLFENPTVITGLRTTTELLNRSVESLMESIFYSLLDQTFKAPMTDNFFISTGSDRKVYTANKGAFVVVDRFFYGPGYEKKLGQLKNIPVTLGSQVHTDIYDIYLRSDGQRLEENKEIGKYRYFVNNLFGLLPLLTKILPPSFNPNELYDPLHLLETPFIFPLDKKRFESMLIGSVRSYRVSGGISLPIDLALQRTSKISDFLSKNEAKSSLPYTVFVQGEHRINVMRKEENIAWVGLTRSHKTGHSLAGFIGNTYYLLKNSLKVVPWDGIPVNFFPIDFELSKALINEKNILFAFKMDKEKAVDAYKEAVRGNFAPAFDLSKNEHKTGVTYHFSSETDSLETKNEIKNSYFVYKNDQIGKTKQSEIKLEDKKGVSYILEGTKTLDRTSWNMLIGEEKTTIKSSVTMEVDRKEKSKLGDKLQYDYAFKSTEPYHIIFNLEIHDRATDAEEYKGYLNLLRKFSMMPLKELFEVPFRSEQKLRNYRMRSFFDAPHEPPHLIHITPTTLGRLNAHASVHLPYPQIESILKKSEREWWQAISKAFGLSKAEANLLFERNIQSYLINYGRQIILSPLKLVNLNLYQLDTLSECLHFTNTLEEMKLANSPTELLRLFTSFFNTNYPEKSLLALLYLVNLKQTPRRVTLFMKPANSLDSALKERFRKTNQIVFLSKANFPTKKRYEIAQDKFTAFFPGHLDDTRDKPLLTNISINIDHTSQAIPTKPILVKVRARKVPFDKASSMYIRLQTAGSLHISNYNLGETVLQLKPTSNKKNSLDEAEFKFFLTGSQSPFSGFFFEQMTELGGDFLLTISLSTQESIWTQKKTVKFKFEEGSVFPMED
ncbi:MAG: hypothetical protein AB8G05_02115 [Oligoflexales bacterium]